MIEDHDFHIEWIPACPVQLNENALKRALISLCRDHDFKALSLEINLLDDEEIQTLNRQYLGHDYPTDILTFDLSFDETAIEGSLHISLEMVGHQAHEWQLSFEDELFRVIVHGVLHLVGYDDLTAEDKAEMVKMEDRYLDQCST